MSIKSKQTFVEQIKWMQDMHKSHTKNGECAYCRIPFRLDVIKPKHEKN